MAAKKMIPPRDVENLLGDDYDEFKIGISFRTQAGHVLMQFSDELERVRMTSGGARKLAGMLTDKAAELDRLGNASAPGPGRVRSRLAASDVKPGLG
jgi:hypothetical protein